MLLEQFRLDQVTMCAARCDQVRCSRTTHDLWDAHRRHFSTTRRWRCKHPFHVRSLHLHMKSTLRWLCMLNRPIEPDADHTMESGVPPPSVSQRNVCISNTTFGLLLFSLCDGICNINTLVELVEVHAWFLLFLLLLFAATICRCLVFV